MEFARQAAEDEYAIVAGLAAFAWLPYNPIWAVLLIMVSVGVIYALTALGRDMTKA